MEEEGELDDQLVYEVSAAKMWRGFDGNDSLSDQK